MPRLALLAAFAAACGGGSGGSIDARVADGNTADVALDAPHCAAATGAYPRAIPVDAEAEGAGDPSFAADPASDRLWMTYSSVALGPSDLGLVSTRLAYSDDGGATFCDAGVINASTAIATPPPELAGVTAYWNHEVSTLIYDPQAPAAEAWRLDWQRYIIAATGGADQRQFQYSWISEKRAASPTLLASAPEHKLLAAAGYATTSSVQAYNDAVIGPPETRVDQLDPALADCAVMTEPGLYAAPDARWLAIYCGTPSAASARTILLEDARAGSWHYVARLLGQAEAQHIDAALDGFGAPALFASGGSTYLLATPSAGGIYKGCIEYQLALPAGTLYDGNGDGQPDPLRAVMGPTSFSGACAYDPRLGGNGFAMDSFDISVSPPAFSIVETGVTP